MRRTPVRRKSKKRKAKQLLDLEIKAQAMDRDGGQCVVPTRFRNHGGCLQAAHVYSKGRWPNLRHEVDNILTMCWSHHFHWAHKEPIEFTHWFEETYPERAEKLAAMKLL